MMIQNIVFKRRENPTKKIVNDANGILTEIYAATVTDLDQRQDRDDIAMVTAPKRKNDNDFNHSASKEVLEKKIVHVHTDTTQNNTRTQSALP
ncbi:hypothetical protein TSUD_241550 [Trifolium subterraneum]|uniref:Uncharacterized protein n=1 Tax=Trifolium subterraneum TaxID=3900 RepID=A0A2Z6P6V7_TRISU|nr:hypothetical protein TSUD_241550 [Trifolium subterraneum]